MDRLYGYDFIFFDVKIRVSRIKSSLLLLNSFFKEDHIDTKAYQKVY